MGWNSDGALVWKVYWGAEGKRSQAFGGSGVGTLAQLGLPPPAPNCPMLPPLGADNRRLRQVLSLEFDFHFDRAGNSAQGCAAETLPLHCPLVPASHGQRG